MSGRQAFDELTKDFTPERRARVDARKAALRAAMPLHELRRARAMTQKAVGDALKVKQPAVAKLERRADMYVSNLRAYIEAMGGRLNIVAEFPQGSVVITNFSVGAVNRRPARSLWLLQGRHTVFFFDRSATVNPSDWRICNTLGTIWRARWSSPR